MCIADGVGGWARSGRGGADAGRWSRLLTHFCEVEVAEWWAGAEAYLDEVVLEKMKQRGSGERVQQEQDINGWASRAWAAGRGGEDAEGLQDGRRRKPLDPIEIMQKGFEKCLACVTAEVRSPHLTVQLPIDDLASQHIHGSSTCLLALLHHSTLLIANLGDCCLLVIRSGEVIFRTSEMQHAFNFPLQLGTHSRDEPMKDARRYDVDVGRGDVVVVGSDGLMDNLVRFLAFEMISCSR